MTSTGRHPSLIECEAYLEGVSATQVRTFINAKALPAPGESYTALCKWPRHTAKGYDDRGEFWWATVAGNGDTVFIRLSKEQPTTVHSGIGSDRGILLQFFILWVLLWITMIAVFAWSGEPLFRAMT